MTRRSAAASRTGSAGSGRRRTRGSAQLLSRARLRRRADVLGPAVALHPRARRACTPRSTATATSTTSSTSHGWTTARGRTRPSAASRPSCAARSIAAWRCGARRCTTSARRYEGDRIEVGTWPVLNDERLRIERRFQIRRKSDGATLVRALVHYVCIDLADRPRETHAAGVHEVYRRAGRRRRRRARETEPFQPGVEPR